MSEPVIFLVMGELLQSLDPLNYLQIQLVSSAVGPTLWILDSDVNAA